MKKDPDLKSFQDLPEFQELLKAPPAGARGRGGKPAVKRAAMRVP
jgi:hypothetical protein